MAADPPASARLSAVAPAGRSAASYTTSGDTTHHGRVSVTGQTAGTGSGGKPSTVSGIARRASA